MQYYFSDMRKWPTRQFLYFWRKNSVFITTLINPPSWIFLPKFHQNRVYGQKSIRNDISQRNKFFLFVTLNKQIKEQKSKPGNWVFKIVSRAWISSATDKFGLPQMNFSIDFLGVIEKKMFWTMNNSIGVVFLFNAAKFPAIGSHWS
jgi:hypothetical protein